MSGSHPDRLYLSHMALVKTPAIVLQSFKYSESSKIVRLATAELGVQSAIAKGAMRAKSKFGARLQTLSEGIAHLYVKPNRDLQTLGEFEIVKQRLELAQDVRRFAAATALAELTLRFASTEPNPAVFDCLSNGLDRLSAAEPEKREALALAALWNVIVVLGFAPSVDGCARDGRSLPEGTAAFSVNDGGFLCASCAREVETTPLAREDRETLVRLVEADSAGVDTIPLRHAAAHRRLLASFVRRHLGADTQLNALDFWEELPWTSTS